MKPTGENWFRSATAILLIAVGLGLLANGLRARPLPLIASQRDLARQLYGEVRAISPARSSAPVAERRAATAAPSEPAPSQPALPAASDRAKPAVRTPPKPKPPKATLPGPVAAAPAAQATFADLKEAKRLYDQGALFLDARLAEEFKQGHIKGAASLPSDQVTSLFVGLEPRLRAAAVIVTYCDKLPCDRSAQLADELTKRGFKTVYIFFEGYPAWAEAGFPVEKGRQ